MNKEDDILKLMEERLKYHKTELARIQNAIAAYKGINLEDLNQASTPKEKTVKWTKEIEKIFKTQDNLTADEIQEILINNGIEQASDPKGRSAMLTTLGRMVNKKKQLFYTEDKHYKKKPIERVKDKSNEEIKSLV